MVTNLHSRHPGESGGPGDFTGSANDSGLCAAFRILGSGLRRNDGVEGAPECYRGIRPK